MGGLVEIEGKTIPAWTAGTLARYFLQHIPPGGFMEAVLRNDLFGAIGHADEMSVQYLRNTVVIIANYIPMSLTKDGYLKWLKNDDDEWHNEAISYYGKRWEPFLEM